MIEQDGFGQAFLSCILLVPLLETLLGQWFPIHMGRFFTGRPMVLIWLSTAVFTALVVVMATVAGLLYGAIV